MTMTDLCWSWLIECMQRVLFWRALDKQLVRSYCCVCTWIGRCYVLAIDAIWSCNLTLVHTSYTTITMTGLHRSSCMQCISFWPWANSAYVYNAWIYVLLVFDAVISPSWALMRSLNIWNGCRIGPLNKQAVRWYCLDWAVLQVVDAVWFRNLTLWFAV